MSLDLADVKVDDAALDNVVMESDVDIDELGDVMSENPIK